MLAESPLATVALVATSGAVQPVFVPEDHAPDKPDDTDGPDKPNWFDPADFAFRIWRTFEKAVAIVDQVRDWLFRIPHRASRVWTAGSGGIKT